MDQFTHILRQIPNQVYFSMEQYTSTNIALIKPITYATDITLYSDDYNITFPTQAPPPIKIGNKEYDFQARRIVVFNPRTRQVPPIIIFVVWFIQTEMNYHFQ